MKINFICLKMDKSGKIDFIVSFEERLNSSSMKTEPSFIANVNNPF